MMQLSLRGVAGPLAGTTIALSDGLPLADGGAPDAAQRRPACRVRSADEQSFELYAPDRDVPVFVNGLPLTRRPLQQGDEVRIGDSVLVVHADEEPVSRNVEVVACSAILDEDATARTLLEVSIENVLRPRLSPDARRDAQDLAAFMRITAALSSIHGLADLDAPLAALVMETVPAHQLAFVDQATDAATISAWASQPRGRDEFRIDAALLRNVRQHAIAVVGERTRTDGTSRQILAAPMAAFGRPQGAIWAEAHPDARFDEGHAHLLLVIAALAGLTRARARESERLQETHEIQRAELNLEHNLVGRSRGMRQVIERIGRVAATDATVLIHGESGTGKELVARAIHRNSRRAHRPFVAINCASLTEALLESELFGHEKGAFTGAIGQKKGRLELAEGGTIFLDEIGELPLSLQAKLLRAIQEREFERVGGTRPVHVDFRLIAATNRDLDAAAKAGTFRQDLYYRLNVVSLPIGPLRSRRDDIPMLAEYFVRKHASRCGRRVTGLSHDVVAIFTRYDWPGNVRELENAIEQALVLGLGNQIVAADLPPALLNAAGQSPAAAGSYHDAIEQAKRDLIVRAFERAGGRHAGAARLLRVHPNYLHRLVRNLHLKGIVKGSA
jgi:Nif-specific regulatory protein